MTRSETFDTAYPRYPFSSLVVLGFALGSALRHAVDALSGSRTDDAGIGHTA